MANIEEFVEMTIQAWGQTHDAATIRERVQIKLSMLLDNIIHSAAGMTYSFGQWEIEHHSDNNPVIKRIVALVDPEVDRWIEESLKDPPEMSKPLKEKFRKLYAEIFEEHLEYEIRERAHEDARELAERLVAEGISKIDIGVDEEEEGWTG